MNESSPGPVFEVGAGAATDPGALRERNEDSHLVAAPVFLVADGMGGHEGGAEASRIIVEEFETLSAMPWLDPAAIHDALAGAARRISGLSSPVGAGRPGSTVSGVGLAQQDGRAYWLVFNVGDSRTYRLANGMLEQVTVDHTRVQELVDAGQLNRDEAARHKQRNLITRAVGAGGQIAPSADLWLIEAAAGERVLICSDGLTGELTEQLITATLIAQPDPGDAAHELVQQAVDAGGHDNVTAVVVDAIQVSQPEVVHSVDETGEDTYPELVAAGSGDTLPGVDPVEDL